MLEFSGKKLLIFFEICYNKTIIYVCIIWQFYLLAPCIECFIVRVVRCVGRYEEDFDEDAGKAFTGDTFSDSAHWGDLSGTEQGGDGTNGYGKE